MYAAGSRKGYSITQVSLSSGRILVSGTNDLPELIHEIWIDGEGLPGVCLAGPSGDDFRRLLDPGARLVYVFAAASHFTAMQLYHAYLGREPYTTDQSLDFEPYPESWKAEQERNQPEWRALHGRWLWAR